MGHYWSEMRPDPEQEQQEFLKEYKQHSQYVLNTVKQWLEALTKSQAKSTVLRLEARRDGNHYVIDAIEERVVSQNRIPMEPL